MNCELWDVGWAGVKLADSDCSWLMFGDDVMRTRAKDNFCKILEMLFRLEIGDN